MRAIARITPKGAPPSIARRSSSGERFGSAAGRSTTRRSPSSLLREHLGYRPDPPRHAASSARTPYRRRRPEQAARGATASAATRPGSPRCPRVRSPGRAREPRRSPRRRSAPAAGTPACRGGDDRLCSASRAGCANGARNPRVPTAVHMDAKSTNPGPRRLRGQGLHFVPNGGRWGNKTKSQSAG